MGNDDTRDKREPVAVTLAPLPWDKELWQMVKRQGITVVLLAVATWLLWGTWQADRVVWEQRMETTHKIHAEAVKELANQHTQQIKTLSDTFVTEQNRTEIGRASCRERV